MKKENILIVEKSEWTSLWNIHTCPLFPFQFDALYQAS